MSTECDLEDCEQEMYLGVDGDEVTEHLNRHGDLIAAERDNHRFVIVPGRTPRGEAVWRAVEWDGPQVLGGLNSYLRREDAVARCRAEVRLL